MPLAWTRVPRGLADDEQTGVLVAADHRPWAERQVGLAQAAGPDLFKQGIESVHGPDSTRVFPAPACERAADTHHAAAIV